LKQDKTLKKAVEIIKQEFDAKRVFLFGSRATGKSLKDSDYDFVVVTNQKRRPGDEKIVSVKSKLLDIGITADLFVYTEKLFRKWENEFSSIPETAKNTGIELSI
jgi:predicted nucleotidyltransferase